MAIAQLKVPAERLTAWAGYDGLVQLISVDGQRTVGCPVLGPRRRRRCAPAARPLSRHGDRPPHRCRGDGPPAPGRARPLGAAARAGGRAGRLGPRAAARRLRRSPATASTASPTAAASTPCDMLRMWRGSGLSGWDPAALQHRHPGHHRGLPGAARHRLRARHHARRRRRAPSSPTSATAPRARATWPRPSASPPATWSRSSSSARTTSGRSPSRCGCSRTPPSPSGGRATASPACRWTATTCSPCSPPPVSPSPAPTPARARRSSRR